MLAAALQLVAVGAACTSATLTSVTGNLVSSTYTSSPLEAGDSCTFRISPDANEPVAAILLVFDGIDVPTAEIFVYEVRVDTRRVSVPRRVRRRAALRSYGRVCGAATCCHHQSRRKPTRRT